MKTRHASNACIASAATFTLILAGCAMSPGNMNSPTAGATASTPAGLTPLPLVASSVGRAASVPESVKTPLGQAMFLLASGSGVQIYDCAVKAGASAPAWTLRAPEATLTDASGTVVGKHYGGPTWESTDGSMVVGSVSAMNAGPDASAIPWLLLSVKSTSGSGVMTQTKSIQRLQTVGGVMPTTACTAGQTMRVPYAATYAFFRVAP